MSGDHFLTTREVLDYLQVTLRTVYRLIHAGSLPAVRVGRQWRFRRQDVDAWLDASRRAARHHGSTRLVHRPRVLVVDDEPIMRQILTTTLGLADYDVDAAPDGASAIDRVRGGTYDLIITDLKMPDIDGFSVIRAARQTAPALPAIIITGYSTEASAIEALNLGVAGYLTKPFPLPSILAATARALDGPAPAGGV